jgi:hypothetical protein
VNDTTGANDETGASDTTGANPITDDEEALYLLASEGVLTWGDG